MLGLTKPKFMAVLAGQEKLPSGGTGPDGMVRQLQKIDVLAEVERLRRATKEVPVSRKDALIKQRQYLAGCEATGVHPSEWFLTKAPVLPPLFRPVSKLGNDVPLVSDANSSDKELFDSNKFLGKAKQLLGDEGAGEERLAVYNSFKAVVGLGDPLNEKLKAKKVRGILKEALGSSPRYSVVQRKLLSSTVDNVGRSVITPNPQLDKDTIGLPEDAAFDIYASHLARRMRRGGMPLVRALEEIYVMLDHFLERQSIACGDRLLLFIPESGQFNFVLISLTAVSR